MNYHLIVHDDLKERMDGLYAAAKQDPNSDTAREFHAAMRALAALRDGREGEYEGKQLGYGPQSHDLRDCAELKVPVIEERDEWGNPLGPSHRLTYREFEPLPKVENGRVVPDPDARPYRQAVAFEHRANDPAGVTGERLGRERGRQEQELSGLGGGRPDVGPRAPGAQTTPNRIDMPADVLAALRAQRGVAPASAAVQGSIAAAQTAAARLTGDRRATGRATRDARQH